MSEEILGQQIEQEARKRPGRPKKVDSTAEVSVISPGTGYTSEPGKPLASNISSEEIIPPLHRSISEVLPIENEEIDFFKTDSDDKSSEPILDPEPEPIKGPELIPETVPEPEQETDHNWNPIQSAPRNGFPVKITDDIRKIGIVAFWRKSRAFANATHRWEETGFWTDSSTGRNIDFKPLWWKDRNAG